MPVGGSAELIARPSIRIWGDVVDDDDITHNRDDDVMVVFKDARMIKIKVENWATVAIFLTTFQYRRWYRLISSYIFISKYGTPSDLMM